MGIVEDLSAAFVAFTIEADDTAEARRGGRKGPWLTSLAMWRNCMQWLPAEGMSADEAADQAWGGDAADLGRRAGEIERRWAERFGAGVVGELRAALVALAERLDPGLPDTMPIIRHGWETRREDEPERRPGPVAVAGLGLDSLLARPPTAFALEYEASGKLSLALHANLLAEVVPTPGAKRGDRWR